MNRSLLYVVTVIAVGVALVGGYAFAAENNKTNKSLSESAPPVIGSPSCGCKLGGMKGVGQTLKAEALGMTVDAMRAAQREGSTLNDLLAQQNLTLDQFHAKILDLKNAEWAKQVVAGTLTQAQADQLFADFESKQGSCTGESGQGCGCGKGAGCASKGSGCGMRRGQ
ncbi:MAG: hypothetical protein WCV84_05110 [Patescibacteria group bacterium]